VALVVLVGANKIKIGREMRNIFKKLGKWDRLVEEQQRRYGECRGCNR